MVMVADAPVVETKRGRKSNADEGNNSAPGVGIATTNIDAKQRLEAEFDHTFKRDIGRGIMLDYLTKEQVESRVMDILGPWNVSFTIEDSGVNAAEDECYAKVTLSITWPEGQNTSYDAVGGAKIKRRRDNNGSLSLGNDMKAAVSDAYKKAAASAAGVGRYLSAKDPDAQELPGAPATSSYSGPSANSGVQFPSNNSTGVQTTGVIEAKSGQGNSIKVNGEWYRSAGQNPISLNGFERGMTVTITHPQGKTFINGISAAGGSGGGGAPEDDGNIPF